MFNLPTRLGSPSALEPLFAPIGVGSDYSYTRKNENQATRFLDAIAV